jgi:pyruvate dehydrogenase E2 component (dihydrolipoamide acetyltransferase)
MPRLSDSMEEGTILKWLKAEGEEIAPGDELVEIETDKANMVYEADGSGFLSLIAQEGDTLRVGAPIANLLPSPEERPSGMPPPGAAPIPSVAGGGHDQGGAGSRPAEVLAPEPPTRIESQPTAKDGPIKASPLARRIAGERGLDLSAIVGSGPGGRIVKADVEDASSAHGALSVRPAPQPGPAPSLGTAGPETAKGQVEIVELTKLQQTVARRMAESKATAPHFYLAAEINMSRCVEARARIKAQAKDDEAVPSFNDMVVKACALALREFPRANGSYRDGRLELYSRVNVGIAVAAQDALVVPTVFDADLKGLRQIAAETGALAARVRDGTVTPPELSGGTFTVSNLGMFGMASIGPVINAPQAAILGVGEITEKPVVRGGEIATAHVMGATLACDHRILYGADAAQFLARARTLLEEPLRLAF